MKKIACGKAAILTGFEEAHTYLETGGRVSHEILVTTEIDWSWSRILAHFEGVITNKGTRISRAAEVLMIMDKPGVLGAKNATDILHYGMRLQIVCNGNKAFVYCVHKSQGEYRHFMG